MDDTASFGYWVRRWRKARDLTQEQLAKQVACAVVTIKKIEMDERRPSRQMAERLALCLDLPERQRTVFIQVAIGERPAYVLCLPEKPEPSVPQQNRPTHLPAPLTRLVGRQTEVTAIKECLRRSDVRLVTLTGVGGIGKTRLALQTAGEMQDVFMDGVFFIPLASVAQPEHIVSTIARLLGLRIGGPAHLQNLADHFSRRHTLLVLDNFEHLLAAAPIVSELLASTYFLKILITSRVHLHLYGERRFIVQPFELPGSEAALDELSQNDAVTLFTDRAQAVRPDFRLTTENASSIAQICSRLDGLPLALELAAAHIGILPPQTLLAHLENRLSILTDGPCDVPRRQQNLRDAIAWSYDLLSQGEKTLFERLSIFRGGGTLESVQSVCADMEPSALIPALSALVDQSLLQRQETNGETRFTMLETIRQFSAERLADPQSIHERHLAYYLNLAQRAEPELTRKDASVWLDHLDMELDNIRAALKWGFREETGNAMHDSAALLVGTLWLFWYLRGHWREGKEWCKHALIYAPAGTRVRAKALTGATTLSYAQDDYEEANQYAEEAIHLWHGLNDQHGLADILQIAGFVKLARREHAAAMKHFTEGLELYEALKDEPNLNAMLEGIGIVSYFREEYETARTYLEKSLAWYRSSQIKDGLGSVLRWLGDLERTSGSYPQAAIDYREAWQFNNEAGLPLAVAVTVHRLGLIALHNGQITEAQTLFLESLKVHQRESSRQGMVECLAGLAGVAVALGNLHMAVRLFGAAEGLLKSTYTMLTPADRLEWERYEKILHTQVPLDELESLRLEGKNIPLEVLIMEVEKICG